MTDVFKQLSESSSSELWAFLDQPTWTTVQLNDAVAQLLAGKLNSHTVIIHLDRIYEVKELNEISDLQHTALAVAGLRLVEHTIESAQDPQNRSYSPAKVLPRIVHALRNAWKTVREPNRPKLLLLPEVRGRVLKIFATGFQLALNASDDELRSESRIADFLSETSRFAIAELVELFSQAQAVFVKIEPLVSDRHDRYRHSNGYRKFSENLKALTKHIDGDDEHLEVSLICVIDFIQSEPWLIIEREKQIIDVLEKLRLRFRTIKQLENSPQLAGISGSLAAVVGRALGDNSNLAPRLELLHRALLLIWMTYSVDATRGKKDFRWLAQLCYSTAQLRVSIEANSSVLRIAGEVASIYLWTIWGKARYAAAEQGSDWFFQACPNGFADLHLKDLHSWHAWLECLEATHRFTDADKAILMWLPLAYNGSDPSPARKLLLHRAEIKLVRIEALGSDAQKNDIVELKNVLTEAARLHEPGADPETTCLTRPADAIIHHRFSRLFLALRMWREAERQANFAITAQPQSDGWPRREARARAFELMGQACEAQGNWSGAEFAYAESLRSNWTPMALHGRLRSLIEMKDVQSWIHSLTEDPPASATVSDHWPLHEHVLDLLEGSEIRHALLRNADAWLRGSFLCRLLRHTLRSDHPLCSALWHLFFEERPAISVDALFLVQHLVSLRYQDGMNVNATRHVQMIVLNWLGSDQNCSRLPIHFHTILKSTFQGILWAYAETAIKALQNKKAALLNEILRGKRWETAYPSGYDYRDRFEFLPRLKAWLDELALMLGPNWVSEFSGESCWVSGNTWLQLRAELIALLWPQSAILQQFYALSSNGGNIKAELLNCKLIVTVSLKEVVIPPHWGEIIENKLRLWCHNVPQFSPRFEWFGRGNDIRLSLIINTEQTDNATALKREIQKQFERMLEGEETYPIAFQRECDDWFAQIPANEYIKRATNLLLWAHDYATMRTRLWLVEGTTRDQLKHPRIVLHHFKDSAEIQDDPAAYIALMRRFRRYQPGKSRILNFTQTVRDAVERRRRHSVPLHYLLLLEPACLVDITVEVSEFILNALFANAEKSARLTSRQAQIIVRLTTARSIAKLEISNPLKEMERASSSRTGLGHDAVHWIVQMHGGSFNPHIDELSGLYHAEVTLPIAFYDEEK